MNRRAGAVLLAAVVAAAPVAAAPVAKPPLTLLLPMPAPAPPPAPVPSPPPINPGYAPAPPSGLSPILTQPGPVYQLPRPAYSAYPPPALPGPIDQQKLQTYRTDLRSRLWQLQRQGINPGSLPSRELEQQLNAPDAQ
ncbi:MAG TPA: hypothetical protein VMF05_05045 [Stellaceae bacterium]|nr:hypothetical protein [Stellaceae bacterium]